MLEGPPTIRRRQTRLVRVRLPNTTPEQDPVRDHGLLWFHGTVEPGDCIKKVASDSVLVARRSIQAKSRSGFNRECVAHQNQRSRKHLAQPLRL